MKTEVNEQFKVKLRKARAHAFAVLKDKGKLTPEAKIDNIMTITMAGLLGITYTNGKSLVNSSAGPALVHWSTTGFPTYSPKLHAPSKKQKKWSDARLIKSATEETMLNRKRQYYNPI